MVSPNTTNSGPAAQRSPRSFRVSWPTPTVPNGKSIGVILAHWDWPACEPAQRKDPRPVLTQHRSRQLKACAERQKNKAHYCRDPIITMSNGPRQDSVKQEKDDEQGRC